MDFPSNDFNQEPKDDAEVKSWTAKTFGSKFQLMDKVHVNGEKDTTCEVWRWLRLNSSLHTSGSNASKIPWNYAHFLIDRDGKVVSYWNPTYTPDSMKDDVMKLLK